MLLPQFIYANVCVYLFYALCRCWPCDFHLHDCTYYMFLDKTVTWHMQDSNSSIIIQLFEHIWQVKRRCDDSVCSGIERALWQISFPYPLRQFTYCFHSCIRVPFWKLGHSCTGVNSTDEPVTSHPLKEKKTVFLLGVYGPVMRHAYHSWRNLNEENKFLSTMTWIWALKLTL